MEEFAQKIQEAHLLDNLQGLVDLKSIFDQIQEPEKTWKYLCTVTYSVQKWPSQNWKQTFGGYIFYPHKEMAIINSHHSNAGLIHCRNTLLLLTLSATYNNPSAQLYLAEALNRDGRGKMSVIKDLYRKVFQIFEQCPEYPLANFHRARYHRQGGVFYPYDLSRAQELYKKCQTPEADLEILEIRRVFKNHENNYPPTIDEYLNLGAQHKLGKAYCRASYLELDSARKIALLKHAVELEYLPAFWELGAHFSRRGEKEQASKYFLLYGQRGFSVGYSQCAIEILGRIDGLGSKTLLEERNKEELLAAINILEQASSMKDGMIHYYLGLVYHQLFQNFGHERRHQENARRNFLLAAHFGEDASHKYVDQYLDKNSPIILISRDFLAILESILSKQDG